MKKTENFVFDHRLNRWGLLPAGVEEEVDGRAGAEGRVGGGAERQEGGSAGLTGSAGWVSVSSGLEMPTRRSSVPRTRTAGCMVISFSLLWFLALMCALAYAGGRGLGYL
jgi:hypothetical protein